MSARPAAAAATHPVAVAVVAHAENRSLWAAEFRAWNCTNHCGHPHALDCEAERADRLTGPACMCECHDGSEGRS